jgi:hypothetical protein
MVSRIPAQSAAAASRDEQRPSDGHSEPKRRADRDHRRASRVHGLDDLAAVDALQLDGGDTEVAVPELALDDDQRHAFASHLDGVGVPKLVRARSGAALQPAAAVRRSSARAAAGDQ